MVFFILSIRLHLHVVHALDKQAGLPGDHGERLARQAADWAMRVHVHAAGVLMSEGEDQILNVWVAVCSWIACGQR